MNKLICLLLLAATLLTTVGLSACMTVDLGDEAGTADKTDDKGESSTDGTNAGQTPSGDTVEPLALSLQEVADSIKSADYEYPTLVSTEVEDERFEYYYGISKPSGVKETLAVEPMIGSIPFSLCLIRVEADSDVAKLASDIKSSVDPSKWVCVTASYVETAVNGDVIILVMDIDHARAQAMIDAFKAL